MAKKVELNDSGVQGGIRDFILLMLGAPIMKVELDNSQLDLCVQRTCEMMAESSRVGAWSDAFRLLVAQDGALAHAKLILGRIRTKYGPDKKGVKTKSRSGTNLVAPLDGQELLQEGERQYHAWQQKVFGEVYDKLKPLQTPY